MFIADIIQSRAITVSNALCDLSRTEVKEKRAVDIFTIIIQKTCIITLAEHTFWAAHRNLFIQFIF